MESEVNKSKVDIALLAATGVADIVKLSRTLNDDEIEFASILWNIASTLDKVASAGS